MRVAVADHRIVPEKARAWVRVELAAEALEKGNVLRFVARGGSMSPFIRDGDHVTVEPVASIAGGLKVGDVAVFRVPVSGQTFVHRLRVRAEGGWLAHGDRNANSDGVVGDELILGRVKAIEREGRQVLLTRGPLSVVLARISRVILDLRARAIVSVSGRGR